MPPKPTDEWCLAYMYRAYQDFMISQPYSIGDIVDLPDGYPETEDHIWDVIKQADQAAERVMRAHGN